MSTQRSIIKTELIRTLAEVLEVDPATVRPDAALTDINIDSIQLVEVMFAVEEKYGISISYNANSDRIDSIDALLDLIVAEIEAKEMPALAESGA